MFNRAAVFKSRKMKITKAYITNPKGRPYLRKGESKYLMNPIGVVVHWTANPSNGADAEANRNYFQNVTKSASCHIIIDDKKALQLMPFNEVAFHAGNKEGNYNYIGIELCINEDGEWVQTYLNAIDVIRQIMEQFGFNKDNIKRHFDFTGKDCPKMFLHIEYKVRNKKYKGEWNWNVFKHFLERGVYDKIVIEKEVIKTVEKVVYKDLSEYSLSELFNAFLVKFNLKQQ